MWDELGSRLALLGSDSALAVRVGVPAGSHEYRAASAAARAFSSGGYSRRQLGDFTSLPLPPSRRGRGRLGIDQTGLVPVASRESQTRGPIRAPSEVRLTRHGYGRALVAMSEVGRSVAAVDRRRRCPSALGPLLGKYHDLEWGVPIHEVRQHVELLVLEGVQAGSSLLELSQGVDWTGGEGQWGGGLRASRRER